MRTDGGPLRAALLSCGIGYAVLYPVINDVVAASRYDGYDRRSQAVSELSATGAPTRPLLVATGPVFSLMQTGFGAGIWQSAHGSRAIRATGALMAAHGATSLLWLVAPMSRREVIAAGEATSADTMHLVLGAVTGMFVASYVTTFAAANGKAFRLYSLATVATALGASLSSAQVDRVKAGEPTPSMGLLERVGIGAWLQWMAVVAVRLLGRERVVRRK